MGIDITSGRKKKQCSFGMVWWAIERAVGVVLETGCTWEGRRKDEGEDLEGLSMVDAVLDSFVAKMGESMKSSREKTGEKDVFVLAIGSVKRVNRSLHTDVTNAKVS